MSLKLYINTSRLGDSNHLTMKPTRSVEIWMHGRMIGVLENEGDRLIIKYNDDKIQEILLRV